MKSQYTWLVREDKMESNGGMIAEAFRVRNCNNILFDLAKKFWRHDNGEIEYLTTDFLMICASKKDAEAIADDWNRSWKEQGRYLFDVIKASKTA